MMCGSTSQISSLACTLFLNISWPTLTLQIATFGSMASLRVASAVVNKGKLERE